MDILSFLKFFSSDKNIEIFESTENFSTVNLNTVIKDFATPSVEVFNNNINNITSRLYGCDMTFSFYKSIDSVNIDKSILVDEAPKIKELYDYLQNLSGDIKIKVSINKPQVIKDNGVFRIFLFDTFFKSIANLDLSYILRNSIFAQLSCNDSIESFKFIIDEDDEFNTDLFYFAKNLDFPIVLKRDEYYIKDNFNLSSKTLDFKCLNTPYEFYLRKKSKFSVVNDFFRKMTQIVSIIYISNYSEVNGFILNNVIQGYKNIEITTDFNNDSVDTDILIEIYNWIYYSEKFDEKIHIARNIITLDYKDSINDINGKTLSSIQSNFKIYSKNNVERYIQLKNQITEHILNLSMKSIDIVSEFSSNFKNAFLANLSFIFTVIILNVISNPISTSDISTSDISTSDIFNRDLSILYILVAVISVIYLVISRLTTKKDIQHYDDTFLHLKNLYNGLLSPKDLDETFDNAILENDKIHIKNKIQIYTIFWLTTLIISIIALYFLSEWVQTTSNELFQEAIQTFKPSNP